MAITIQQSPGGYDPAYNPIWWVVSSTNTAQTNFQYVCDVYITGVTFAGGATYLRLKAPADPTYGRAAFNVSPILQRQLSGDLGDTIYGFQSCPNSILDYSVKFGEMYGASSGIVVYPSLTNSTGNTAFNGSLQVLENKDYLKLNYATSTAAANAGVNLLTNQPSSGTLDSGYSQWIYAMSQTSGSIKFANINTYDNSNSIVGNYRVINHQYNDTATAANRMIRFPASAFNLNQITTGIYTSDPLPIYNGAAVKWEIYFTDSNHQRVTESFYGSYNTDCTDYTAYHIYFKNKLGGYDTFDFRLASQKSISVEKKTFQKVMGNFKSSSSYTYADADRYDTAYHTRYKENVKLTSNWITEAQSVWLQELFTSPDIRVDNGSHYLVPINIIETNYIQRQSLTDKIFNVEITFQYSFNEVRQGA